VVRPIIGNRANSPISDSHFDDTEIVELAWLISVETYYNVMRRALGIGSDGLRDLAEDRIVWDRECR